MCSKYLPRLTGLITVALVALFMAVATSGCGLKTGDVPDATQKGRLANSTLGCLSGVEERLTSYWVGDLPDQKIKETAACVRGALQLFETIGRGKNEHGFEPSELSGFLNRKFLGQSKISEKLLAALMRIKLVIVGGSDKLVTYTEFQRLQELVNFVEDEALKNRPYVKIYQMTAVNPSVDEVRNARLQLVRTGYSLAEILRTATVDYTIENLKTFIRELTLFLRIARDAKDELPEDVWAERARTYLKVALGQVDDHVAPRHWVAMTGTLAGWYGLFVDYNYTIKTQELSYGDGLANLIRIVLEGFSLIETAIKVQKDSILKFEVIDSIVKELHQNKIIPQELRLNESLIPTIHYVIKYMFRSLDQPLLQSKSTGLDLVNLTEMRREFLVWAQTQKELDQKYDRSRGLFLGQAEAPCNGSMDGFRCLVDSIDPFYQPGSNLVWVLDRAEAKRAGLHHHFSGVSRLNLLRVFSRLLIRGWAEDVQRASLMMGLTESETGKFYTTLRSIGTDLKIMDPRKNGIGERVFKEANLFTFSGNGLQSAVQGSDAHLMTLKESIEQLAIITSGGQLRDEWYQNVLEQCRVTEEELRRKTGRLGKDEKFEFTAKDPIYRYQMVPRACVKSKLGEILIATTQSLPGLNKSLRSDATNREAYIFDMMGLAKGECQSNDWVEYSEFGTMSAVAHYSEVVFARFDLNANGVIDAREAMQAYLNFRIYLRSEIYKRLGEHLSEGMVKSVFTFLLMNGRLPEKDGWQDKLLSLKKWGILYFDNDPQQFVKGKYSVPDFEMNRVAFMKVLKVLNAPAPGSKETVNCQMK